MTLIRCACLVAVVDERLLLVRVRTNEHWYLPGGKIEADELPERALERELIEELGIVVERSSIRYLYTVRGPAYGQPGEVELVCFSARWTNSPQALGEISDVQWLALRERDRFAPAVQILCTSFLEQRAERA
jgi:8-oxo-dGTP pyrophosphatase MutT (NUDIX family)